MITAVIGAQWGDEGKGKIVDYLAEKADYVVRFHGGNNAGHTVVNKFGKFPLHLVPSGICQARTVCLISNGVVVDLKVLIGELEMLNLSGIKTKGRFFISPRCHLIMPYHKILDKLYEEVKGKSKTGTTGSGIGPVYADKVSYNGIRIYDLLEDGRFKDKLETQLSLKNRIIESLGGEPLRIKEILDEYKVHRKKIQPYVKETATILFRALPSKKNILFEGAQGFFLDNDWGTYPFCTASSTVPGSVNAACGLPKMPTETFLVAKAYTTRVGGGPFPTELDGQLGEEIRQRGVEFGTTTGRPRRCGWLDLELIKTSCQLTGATGIALTKLDILDTLSEIKVCIGYELRNEQVGYLDGDSYFLEKVKPMYKEFAGWRSDTSGIKKYRELPIGAKQYLEFIEKFVRVPIKIISAGPRREQTIVRG